MNLSRRHAASLLAAVAALGLARHGSAQDKGTVYYFIPTLLDEFQTESQKAIEALIGGLGYKVVSLDAQNEADRQLRQVEDAILTGPAAFVMNAVDFDAIVPGVEKARAAGIKVLNFDRQIRTTPFDLTSVAGTVDIGLAAAGEAIRLLTARHGSAKGKILQILGDPGDNYTLDIQKGFEERMGKEGPDVELITKAALMWEPTNAGKIFEDQLLVTPDIDLVFTHSSHLTVPIVSIMEAKGMKPGEMMLMSSTGMPVGLDNIRNGWQQVEVEQPTYAQVYGLAMFLPKIMKGEELKAGTYDVNGRQSTLTIEEWGPNLKIPGAVITKENVDDPDFWGNQKAPSGAVKIVE
ncbi:MAG TPA: sugar ABC transporter substrate-binding protein [Geminicoccaceae bacterium]|nr:sugar ABC transporter substrate-binding protein [Geminicoccus sp.]HMU52586.1 sugar ABC transporter substrate-binding protein [Geminicoccaceae bacterium]